MTRLALAGDYNNALTIHHQFTELFKLLFVDGNPAGVKAMLSMMGMIENRLRLPLVPTRITTYEQMRRILDELKNKMLKKSRQSPARDRIKKEISNLYRTCLI